jgi:hypothetical protein
VGYFAKRHRRARPRIEDLNAAAFLPRVCPRREEDWFVRFGIADGTRFFESGIFVAAYKTRDSPDTEGWACDAIADALLWFDDHMPAPHTNDRRARYFLRASEREMARKLWELAHLLRTQGIFVEMVSVRRPGRITAEDDVQIAAIPCSR